MGQEQKQTRKHYKKPSLQESSRIEGLYEMYSESIRLSTLIKSQSFSNQQAQSSKKQIKKSKMLQLSQQKFLEQLLRPFEQVKQYTWGLQIKNLFLKHFSKQFQQKWSQSKQFFYELLLENIGVQPQSKQLVSKSHLMHAQKIKKIQVIKLLKNKKQKEQKTFENYFHKIIKDISKINNNIKSSFTVLENDSINRQKQEEFADIQSNRISEDEEINYINSSIIDAELEKNSLQDKWEKNLEQPQNDQQYFLPLITKRNKFKKQKLSQRISSQINSNNCHKGNQPTIQMSNFYPKANYSRQRIETVSIILPSTVFYQRMNFSAKVETDQLIRIYRQLSNTIQQTINSCNLISCPLKHFMLHFEFKTSKKNINQLSQSVSLIKLNKINSDNTGSSRENIQTSDSMGTLKKYQSTKQASPEFSQSFAQQQLLPFSSSWPLQKQNLFSVLHQASQKSERIRKKRQYNTNYLLQQIKQFTESYSEFLFKYLNFCEIKQTDLQNFINFDTVYGIVLKNIWNIVSWIADRGYQWEQFTLKQLIQNQTHNLEIFTQDQLKANPLLAVQNYAKFCNKQLSKIKAKPMNFVQAYLSLLKLKDEVYPQKYLKKIIIFYRQATKCCQGADDLMSLYEFLLKICILSGFAQQMHLFRMKNIIDKLIPIQSSSIDGAGEIVYAWTTWNIILEMYSIKLKQYKQLLLTQNERKLKIQHEIQSQKKSNGITNTLKDINKSNKAQRQKFLSRIENPQKRLQKKLQF